MMSILKGVSFIVCLAIETDINRDFSTAHCRSSSGDSMHKTGVKVLIFLVELINS